MVKPWKVIEESYYERFALFSAKRSRRENPRTGKPFDFFLMEGVDWTNIVLLTPDQRIVLVEQFRHGVDKITLELPGGAVEKGEEPIIAATREAREETGFTVTNVRSLGAVCTNPAMQSMRLHAFVGQVSDAPPESQILDSGEDIRIVIKPLTEFYDDVRTGRADHALTVSTVGLLLLNPHV